MDTCKDTERPSTSWQIHNTVAKRKLDLSSDLSSSEYHLVLFHIASVMAHSRLHHSQVGLIYSVTPCLVGRVRKDSVLGSAGKTKPAALSPLSLPVSINQPPPPPTAPSLPVFPFPFSFSVPMTYQTNIILKTLFANVLLLCISLLTHTHTKRTHAQKLGHEKVAERGRNGGDHMSRRCISVGSPSALCQTTIT